MRALYCRYAFLSSSDPVRNSIHFAAMSVLSFVELFDTFCEEAPRAPELFKLFTAQRVDGIHLARWALLGRDLLHIDEAALLDAHEQGVDGAFDEIREALLSQ